MTVEWGTTSAQRIVEGVVATLPELARNADIQSPAITIIGDVVRLREQGTRWFDVDLERVKVWVDESKG